MYVILYQNKNPISAISLRAEKGMNLKSSVSPVITYSYQNRRNALKFFWSKWYNNCRSSGTTSWLAWRSAPTALCSIHMQLTKRTRQLPPSPCHQVRTRPSGERERERQTETETERETHRERERDTHTERERVSERERERARENSFMDTSYSLEDPLPQFAWWIILSTTCSNATEVPEWAAPSRSRDHRQLWTMASETVDQNDWPLLPMLHRTVPPELHFYGANAGHKSQDLLQPVGRERATFVMPGHRTTYPANQILSGLVEQTDGINNTKMRPR